MRTIPALLGAVALLGATSSASAAVTICLGAGCHAQPDSLVNVDKDVTGTTVTGVLQNSPSTMVLFSSSEQLINTANGQANIAAVDGVLNNPLTISLASGLISAIEFNLDAISDGSLIFTFAGGNSNGQVSGPFPLDDRGSNWFNGYDGTFASVTLSFANGATISDLKQVRISRAAAPPPAVPEPATWLMMILGFAAIGTAARYRPRKALLAA